MKKLGWLLFMLAIVPATGFSQTDYPVSTIFMPVVFDGKFAFPIETPLPAETLSLNLAKKTEGLTLNNHSLSQNQFNYSSDNQINYSSNYVQQLRQQVQHAALWKNNQPAARYVLSDLLGVEDERLVPKTSLRDIFTVEYELEKSDFDSSAKFVPKRRYWTKTGSSLLQFSQNYISENWYNGGVGNLNMQSVQNYTANYKKDKIQFNNFIEWKLSLFTNPNDTLRNTRFGEDLLRYYGDLGLTAGKNWSYSMNLELKTRLFRSYKENSGERIGSLFSPLNINMGVLGMKYQLETKSKTDKYKKTTISADISPLAVQYTWVSDKLVDPKRYGVKEGEHYLIVFGSSLNAKAVIQFNRQITFSSRLKYFTNYEKILVESENEFNMALSRFLSTRLYLYGRFDDSKGVKRDPDLRYIQLNEVFSFGFNYKW
ncbi:MAG: DUF3078 domain-containing protein [Candidatus Symbiothrix sp.]|jgi:hypothetical protein|nr:DUF3078 domain-containing protein [Candidatus Symbiothrix sp.]